MDGWVDGGRQQVVKKVMFFLEGGSFVAIPLIVNQLNPLIIANQNRL